MGRSRRAAVTATMLYIVGVVVLSQGMLSPVTGWIRRATGQPARGVNNVQAQNGGIADAAPRGR